jgi:hypothetical protein
MSDNTEEKGYTRRFMRVPPDPTDFAQIDTDPNRDEFKFEFVALIKEEAPMGGCGIICLKKFGLKKDQTIKIKVGRMDPLYGEVVWVKALDEGVNSFGIKFLD